MTTMQNCVAEWHFTSRKSYADPFHDVELDVIVTDPDGAEHRVPAFWAGGATWRVRYSPAKIGKHTWCTACSDETDPGLHGATGVLDVMPYDGDNPLFRHGSLRPNVGGGCLEHADGTPFFWLGDTWWMGLCKRLEWPGEFRELTADRVRKGFTVVQIVAGLYPDMPAFDERGANEAGYPWEAEFARINPAWFDMADLRIDYLVRNGLTPCIVGCWGYYLKWLGVPKMKQHWRYLVARWGAYPVVWCLAGEGSMPYYLSKTPDEDREFQKQGWTEIARYVRRIDPSRRPITIHPSTSARDTVADPGVLDFDMLQTGHGDRRSLPNTVRLVTRARNTKPRMPVIEGEVCYEGIGGQCREEVQRLMFWACFLSGAQGFTYGANGIWQVNRREQPYGASPHGMAWGHTPWDEAARLPGGRQLGLARRLLERFRWWKFESHPEWVAPHWTAEDYLLPYAGGIPGEVRIIYWFCMWGMPEVREIEADASYRSFLFNPVDGSETDLGAVDPDAGGTWRLPISRPPIYQDWVLVLERAAP
ncbi:MAG: DUF4038 domain-containing protein [Kiritimatiellaeota bacterium]|nr:DUF4038 domain-containing protein [Kiritimatiellota bacterium]